MRPAPPVPEDEFLRPSGLDAVTGAGLFPALPLHRLARLLRAERSDPEALRELVRWLEARPRLPRGVKRPKEGVAPRRLDESGWGVIFAPGLEPGVRAALEPLLERRRVQATKRYAALYRECHYRPGESKTRFLARHNVGPGPVDPVRMPYYLLLVGGPEQIPFEFQYQLDLPHAVGRLAFDTAAEYARYAAAVLAAEDAPPLRARALFFAAHQPGDVTTELMLDGLTRPLAADLAKARPEWTIDTALGPAASKARLVAALTGPEAPALLFTGSHGLGYPPGHRGQRDGQGALLTSDPPFRSSGDPPVSRQIFAAADVPPRVTPGLVAWSFACHSAGTPQFDDFAAKVLERRRDLAPGPFVARLPQRLLARGALAVVGHVERAWDWSFRWTDTDPQRTVFESTLLRLLDGHPVGSAMEYFNQRWAELTTVVEEARRAVPAGQELDAEADRELVGLWAAMRDARNYVVLGDPAVRIYTKEEPGVS